MWDINQHWTAYGSVSDIYKSQANRLSGPPESPASLDPIEGRSYEIGTKASFYDERLTASLALYQIERSGEAIADPDYETRSENGTNCCYVDDGEAESRGVEAEIGGEPFPGLEVTAGYTFNRNENKVTSIAYSTITPKHLFKLWAIWRLPGAWSDWTVGGGVKAQSDRYVAGTARTYSETSGKFDGPSIPFEFTQGGYALWSLRAGYRIDSRWSVAVNVENLFDKTYYRSVGSSATSNWYGEPRNVLLSVKADW